MYSGYPELYARPNNKELTTTKSGARYTLLESHRRAAVKQAFVRGAPDS